MPATDPVLGFPFFSQTDLQIFSQSMAGSPAQNYQDKQHGDDRAHRSRERCRVTDTFRRSLPHHPCYGAGRISYEAV
jgi:hypothetical protein